ncbi:MAG: hypothetical protein ACN6QH_01905 [Pseudomonas sp.]|uniref:hypothetical protein n=1 Tax=Pseudomonas sp. TaxID=306 RepID=UPI003D11D4C3
MSSRYSPSPTRFVLDLQNARSILGKRLSVLQHDQYYFNDEKDLGDIGSLEWCFGEQEVLSMYLLSDGESVGADLLPSGPPASFEIEPNMTCSWRRENLLAGLSATHLENTTICAVEGILDSFNGQEPWMAGFRVTFETGDSLIYLNQGDDAVVLINALPPVIAGLEPASLPQRNGSFGSKAVSRDPPLPTQTGQLLPSAHHRLTACSV